MANDTNWLINAGMIFLLKSPVYNAKSIVVQFDFRKILKKLHNYRFIYTLI